MKKKHSPRLYQVLFILGLLLYGCANPVEATEQSPTKAPTPKSTIVPLPTAPGTMIDVGGYSLYLNCTGLGSPTVILESGLSGDFTSWNTTQPEIAKFTRVCSYDRAGLSYSNPGPTPRDAKLTTSDLHTLLTKANIAPPYILVGHSFGGLLIRRYYFEYPNDVVGMIFIESLHEDWWDNALTILPTDTTNDTVRLGNFRSYLTEGWQNPESNYEGMDISAVVEQIHEMGNFGNLPVTVLTAETFDVLNSGLPPDLESDLANLFREEQGRIAALSTVGMQTIISNSGHDMPHDNPHAVIQAIKEMISLP